MSEDYNRKYMYTSLVLMCLLFSLFSPATGLQELRDVSQGRGEHASQAANEDRGAADLVLDGDITTCARSYDPHTNEAWWMVDLGRQYAIFNVTVHSYRSDPNLFGYISVRVSDSPDISEHTVRDQCALWSHDRFPAGSNRTLVCDQIMYGRYVSIQRNGGYRPQLMTLCEVKVMGRELETQCSECNEEGCCPSFSCGDCKPGFKTKECLQSCPPGHYGDDCFLCSAGCAGVCQESTGACRCKPWWIGSRCETWIAPRGLPLKRLRIVSKSNSSATVKWEKIVGVPSDLDGHYQYVIEYMEQASSTRFEGKTRLGHESSSSLYQEATLNGLKYGTVYRVYLKSYRVLGYQQHETAAIGVAVFTTNCQAPEKPKNLKIKVGKSNGGVLILNVSCEAPQVYHDCRRIVDIRVQYRSKSSSENDWVESDTRLTAQQTSVTLSDLQSDDYVIRLYFQNEGGLTSFAEKFTKYNTLCSQCFDKGCETNEPCENCRPGFKPPECRDDCDPSFYGAGCSEKCSKGCKDTCDRVSGMCICQQWWKGNNCTTEIGRLGVSGVGPSESFVDESSAVIRWKKIANVPANLSEHYQYDIEYKEKTSSGWIRTRYSHDPSSDQYQEATLTGLMYNTIYDVRVTSYRVLGDDREHTGTTQSSRFQTKCTTPSKPRDVTAFKTQRTENTLFITWEKAAISGCNKASYQILYRLRSASVSNWTVVDSHSSTSHTLRLDSGTYDIRVQVTNDGNSSFGYRNFAEVPDHEHEHRGKRGSVDWLIVGTAILCVVVVVALTVALGFLYYRVKQLKKRNKAMQTTVALSQIGVSMSDDTVVNPNLVQGSEAGYEEPINDQNAFENDDGVAHPELQHMPSGYITPADPIDVSGFYEEVGVTRDQARKSGDYEKPAVYENVDGPAPIHVYDQLQSD